MYTNQYMYTYIDKCLYIHVYMCICTCRNGRSKVERATFAMEKCTTQT